MPIGPSKKAVLLASWLTLSGAAGCTSILGTFSEGPADGGNMAPDTAGMDAGGDARHHLDAAKDAPSMKDAPMKDAPEKDVHHKDAPVEAANDGPSEDAPSEASTITANTALAITAGGAFSSSTNYKLFGAIGQAPGGNTSASSPSYKLQGGVIGATQ